MLGATFGPLFFGFVVVLRTAGLFGFRVSGLGYGMRVLHLLTLSYLGGRCGGKSSLDAMNCSLSCQPHHEIHKKSVAGFSPEA